MFNRFYKTIHNHYTKFFKILYFLRYLIPIFLAAIILYVSIPKFFDYEKKEVQIKNFLLKSYQLELNSYNSIRYNIFPTPNISLENVNLVLRQNSNNLKVEKINIYLKLDSIYNNNFLAKKIFINKNEMILELNDVEYLLDFFQNIKLKLVVKNLNLNLVNKDDSILKIKNINFSNYGFKKNKFKGMIFDKKFEVLLNKEKKDLKFKILKTGISAKFKLNEYKKRQSMTGTSKINILNNYLKLDYLVKKDQLIIKKSKFRNKDLSLSFQNLIKLNPYFEMNLDIKIEKINDKLFDKLSLEKVLTQKDIIKKLNSTNKIEYKEKKILQHSLIKEYNSQIYLQNGRLNEQNEIKLSGALTSCINETTLLEQPPRFYFQCNLKIDNFKKFNKYFSISNKLNNKSLNIFFKGSINILRKKVNFEKININETKYIANEEDKIFFKKKFEDILLIDGLFGIFKTQNIKYFIKEIT